MEDRVLVFVPGYNISKTIKSAILNLAALRQQIPFDVLYVDNHSSDGSAEIVEKTVQEEKLSFVTIIRNKENLGYGGSQKVAFNYGFSNRYDYLIEYDGDLQYPHEEIPNLYSKIRSGQYSIVFGSRITDARNLQQMPKWKAAGNRVSSGLFRWALTLKVSEIHTGFRIYDLRKIKDARLDRCHDDYRWTMDSVMEILKVNDSFSEIPVKALYHKDASSPPLTKVFTILSYMCWRALKYKIRRLMRRS